MSKLAASPVLGIILFSGFLAAYFSHKWDD
ncbi:protein MgtS [Escherichia coli]|nr:protein MgtS [Escherichia coli]MDM1690042.1 protein MgtS [Escherichia coli]